MEKDLIWLKTSLFADKSQWAFVLKNAIRAFVNAPLDNPAINAFLIEFNQLCGENIRLGIQTERQNASTMAQKIDAYFRSFFRSNPLEQKKISLPIDGIFLPFPANTIQYGLYTILINHNVLEKDLPSKISMCMLDALEDNLVDDETLITLSFYMHCTLLNELNALPQIILSSHYNYMGYQEKTGALKESYLCDKYDENKTSLLEISEAIKNHIHKQPQDNPRWLTNWINDCRYFLHETPVDNEISFIIRNYVNKQLGLTDNMILLVYYFLNKIYTNKSAF